MLDRKKENNTVCSSINSSSNLVNNVFASVHYLSFNIKLLFFSPKTFGVSQTLCQKVVNTAGGIVLPGDENLGRNDFWLVGEDSPHPPSRKNPVSIYTYI